MNLIPLFPDGLGVIKNSIVNLDKDLLLSTLVWKNDISLQGNFDQSQTNLHELAQWEELFSWIKTQAKMYWKLMGWKCDDLWFTQSWINNMSAGGGISSHWHSNSMISGVYYFIAEEGTGGTVFESTKNRLEGAFQTEINEVTQFTMGKYLFPASEDTLVLFPSYISHLSEYNKVSSKRYTLAFNLLPATLGKENHFNYAKLR